MGTGRPVVLHIMQAAGIGGAERHLISMLPSLRSMGWDIRFWGFTTSDDSVFATELAKTGVPVTLERFSKLFSAGVIRAMRREIRNTAPQIVHTHLFYADVEGQLAKLWAGVRSVRTIHTSASPIGGGRTRLAFSAAGVLADRTIAVSEHVANMTRRMRFAPARKIRVIPYGIDAVSFSTTPERRSASRRDLGFEADDFVVACTSRLVAGKGQDVLIRACALAKRSVPGLRLVVAGEGPEESRLRDLAAEMLTQDAYRLTGFLSDVRPVLWASDVYVLPTLPELGEGLPVATLEAMAAGLPVIASDLPPLREAVVSGETGFLTEPGQVQDLSRCIVRLTLSPELRKQMAAGAIDRVKSKFSQDRLVEKTADVYRELLA